MRYNAIKIFVYKNKFVVGWSLFDQQIKSRRESASKWYILNLLNSERRQRNLGIEWSFLRENGSL